MTFHFFDCRVVMVTLAALAALPAPARGQDGCGEPEPPPGPLVSAAWVRCHRTDPGFVLLQVARSRAPFDSAHIAGAQFVAPGDFTVKQGDLLTELPPVERLDSLLETLGVGERGRIVLYGETLLVTRLFFTLDYVGLGERVSVMDGGLPAWRAAGGPLTTEASPAPARATLSLSAHPELVADAAWVNGHRASDRVVVLDARTRAEYEGTQTEEGAARPGHIPGAMNLDWTATIADGKFRGAGELRQLLTGVGAMPGKELVTYCRVGTRASVLYFVGRMLGYRVRLYDGSMNEWAGKAELPIATGPPPRP